MESALTRLLGEEHRLTNNADPASVTVAGMTSDSREVRNNFLFFAQSGIHRDGNAFIRHAIAQGASAVVSERPFENSLAEQFPRVALILSKDVKESMATLSARFYGTDLGQMNVIGITGTNGKSTIAHFLNQIIRSYGIKTVLMGTIGIEIAGETVPTDYTTPPAYDIHRHLRTGSDAGAAWVIMEVSSHALKLKRVAGMTFDRAIFTNLTHEHREIHPTMDDYYETKSGLFRMLKTGGIAVINSDDPFGQKLIKDHSGRINIMDYGKNGGGSRIKNVCLDRDRMIQIIELDFQRQSYRLELGIPGLYNAFNACAAFTALQGFGFDPGALAESMRNIRPPEGRFCRYRADERHVVIDFAHTPDGLEKILTAVRELMMPGQMLIVLFGCPGDRDKTKRPLMGRIASQLADKVIVTSDDPHFEDPCQVIRDITVDTDPSKTRSITDRREAIQEALSVSRKGDWIVIAGRGHERFQYIRDDKILFHDKDVFFEEARKLGMNALE